MSVTKVSDLHESVTALDMIGHRTKSLQRKNVPVAKLQLQMVGQNDLTLPNLSLLLPTTLCNGGGGQWTPLLTHEPFALTTSNLVGC